jgi:nucleotide-binding universal stress UspA family protein
MLTPLEHRNQWIAPYDAPVFSSIVVGTDGSDTAKEAVRQATELAKAVNAQLNVVSAYEPVPEGRLRLERQDVPPDLEWSINPREDVESTLSGADLIVVGNKGMTGAKRFLLGSVPNKVSHHAPCSVLIIRTT